MSRKCILISCGGLKLNLNTQDITTSAMFKITIRIGKWGGDDHGLDNYNGQHFDDQLWKFEKYGDFYRIFNYEYEDAKIAKWGKGDSDWDTFDDKLFDDQLWKLTFALRVIIDESLCFDY